MRLDYGDFCIFTASHAHYPKHKNRRPGSNDQDSSYANDKVENWIGLIQTLTRTILISSGVTKKHWYMAAQIYDVHCKQNQHVPCPKTQSVAGILQGETEYPDRLPVSSTTFYTPYTWSTASSKDRSLFWTNMFDRNLPWEGQHSWKRRTHYRDIDTKWHYTLYNIFRQTERMCGHYTTETEIWDTKLRGTNGTSDNDRRDWNTRIWIHSLS